MNFKLKNRAGHVGFFEGEFSVVDIGDPGGDGETEGGYWYSFQTPYRSGRTREWFPKGRPPDTAEERAFCHTHPNITGFSKPDIDTALGISYPNRVTFYMVNKAGAYWYDGTLELKMYARNHIARYGTYWGTPYTTMAK